MKLTLFVRRDHQRGRITHLLHGLGPTWSASPVRRVMQTLCLAGFAVLFLYVCWPYGGADYSATLAARQWISAEIFLMLDPLVGICAAVAARLWVGSAVVAAAVLCVCMVFPRGFCGYVCPMGTCLDVIEWAVGRRIRTSRAPKPSHDSGCYFNSRRSEETTPKYSGWWVHLRYFILAAVLIAAGFGVLLSGFVAAIAVWTRAMLMLAGPLQVGLLKGWYLVPPMNAGHWVSLALFAMVLGLSLLERRFWCKYLCPTGAIFSLGARLSLTKRTVTTACIDCGRCRKVCDFAAIADDYSTRHGRCCFCQSCGGVCPTGAIEFTGRWSTASRASAAGRPAPDFSRRSILAGLGIAATAGAGLSAVFGKGAAGEPAVRAPGSVPEEAFLQLCVRCGQCIKVCPNNVLQPAGLENGLNGLWAPRVVADWSGCEPSCNNCGQVCPTGAIRALPLEEKRAARIGLAIVDRQTCLPHAGRAACRYCVDECAAAGYEAIEFVRVGGQVDNAGQPIEGSGFLAPVVLEDRCVGCGLCQMRCRAMNVKNDRLLDAAAITIHAGPGREDRLLAGSYIDLHDRRQAPPAQTEDRTDAPADDYLPDFLR